MRAHTNGNLLRQDCLVWTYLQLGKKNKMCKQLFQGFVLLWIKVSSPSLGLFSAKFWFKAGGRPYNWIRKSWNDSSGCCQQKLQWHLWTLLDPGCRGWGPHPTVGWAEPPGRGPRAPAEPQSCKRAASSGPSPHTACCVLGATLCFRVYFWILKKCLCSQGRLVKWVDHWESADTKDRYWYSSCWDLDSKYLYWKMWIMVMLDINRSAF